MTVADLIKALKACDPNSEVRIGERGTTLARQVRDVSKGSPVTAPELVVTFLWT